MTDKLRAAAEQALACLEELQGGCTDSNDGTVEAITVWCPEVIDALRAALAEPPAEPVAIVTALSVHADGVVRASLNCELPLMMELYAAPQPKAEQPAEQEPEACKPVKQPLTDEEIHACFQQRNRDKTIERRLIARAIERAHGIGEQE